ncbi:hypothetical protein AMS68_001655 [Peltaster fructicola]|uniref:HTH APSES-type domain-containing protein n=1 Tax=Peltaster fructicola TaxID=286661 RepID=A0A6H0XNE3_9PEZI|nr:hypothetical protein AMS68_001655 [Peltaster fructicola]
MARNDTSKIYSATYSNVPVYEYNCEGNHVMRRRSDDWINATHILKVADYDKPTRTRILEREVQKGVHEKVQGGYGKYQGTWIPLEDGRNLAERNGVLEKLLPILDFVAGDSSPPPAPKHATAASKPRAPRTSAAQKRSQAVAYTSQPDYDRMDISIQEMAAETPDDTRSESVFDDYDISAYGSSRKRRRIEDPRAQVETARRLWADELLDYFMLKENLDDAPSQAPLPPDGVDLNLPIDDKGHTPLHWAAAMGDYHVVKELLRRGSHIDVQSAQGETPLMFATIYTNCFDKRVMEKICPLLIRTVNMQEWMGGTVFHTIANTTERKSKYACARYYLDCILDRMIEFLAPDAVEQILNEQDSRGDTAVTIAARNGARKCVRSLIGRNAAVDIPNSVGETADQYIVQLNHRRQERLRQLSSSPFQGADGQTMGGAVQHHRFPFDPLNSQASLDDGSLISTDGVYRSEAALSLTSQIMPSVFSKAKQLASSFDIEIAEKDAELAEAKRLVELRQSELDALRRQNEELSMHEMEQLETGTADDQLIETQLADLEQQCLDLMEAEQIYELKQFHDDEQTKHAHEGDQLNSTNAQGALERKMALAREITILKDERLRLMNDVMTKTSYAGIEDGRHADYARLIRGALGINEEELQDVLPDIVSELESGQSLDV